MLHKLVNLRYEPGSSLEKHVDEFHKIHASYLSISADSSISMNLLSSMAAVFFLQSLDNDKELSSLCQTLYDIKPFNLNTITDRVSIENLRRQTPYDQALMFDKNKQAESSKSKVKNQAEGSRKKKGPKDKRKGKNNAQGTGRNTNQEQDTKKRIDRIEQLLEKLQSATTLNSLNAASDSKELNHPPESDSEAFIFEEVNAIIGKNHQRLIYLDSGAGRTVVNYLTQLENPTPVLKHINTFSNPVKVTHQGTLVFKGVKLYPVYYVPDGPVNFLSVSQIVDHGMKLVSKSNMFLIKYDNQIIDTFHQQGNLFASRLTMTSNSVYSLPTSNLDWHLVLGHPSDSYIRFLLKKRKIKGKFTLSSDCPVCQQAKIKNHPHSQTLPCANAPFYKIHMDTLQINPPTRKGDKYVLVLIDDYSHFNRIYLISEKGQVVGHINHGISLERGPPESPQTNGVAERFNQTILSKIRCLLGQSNIPVSYWDEAANHASLLLNLLSHKHLMMKTPAGVLACKHFLIEPEVSLDRLIPFGMKVTTRIPNPASEIEPRGEILRALTFEKYSDGMRLLNLETGKIKVSHDYVVTANNPTLSMNQPESLLPSGPSLKIKLQLPGSKITDSPSQSPVDQTSNSECQPPIPSPRQNVRRSESSKNYEYVPYYKEAPRKISSSISEENTLTGKRNIVDRNSLLLADVVPYSKAVTDPIEAPEWKKAMDAEYQSLTSHGTGELVPYPPKPTKVIGGMWRLSQKRNEHGEVYRYKAQWVVLGNHQEYMLHYYDTWASVSRNETFKIMLTLVMNFDYIPYQFNIETAFLHGDRDALVHVKHVKGYEVKGKESWVWQLRKSLYGTKQAPRMWKAKLTATLSKLGLMSAQSDESLFTNHDKSLLLHIHVNDGFLVSKSENTIVNFLNNLNAILKLKYKKRPTQNLGYNLEWSSNKLKINQTDLIVKLLRQFEMQDSKPVKTPCNGNFLNEINSNLSDDAIQLNGTKDKCLVYKPQAIKETLTGWADADYANDKEDRKSVSGYVILGFSNPICWLIKKQSVVAQSTTEAEYIAMNVCSKQLRWLTLVLNDLGHSPLQPVLINDNSGAVPISKQASLNANTKHIEVRYQYV
ncbi:hypothetical protein O181_071108 [Austropuccinia psidii MF-1]|uniref:Integrase catalytic domain-containing protein n=1 Tax=Austropuccinia psidii MF-1 TaxID=1389203 RepID=A0A9Q3F0E9_9BASI|nr:hypothetical protein [Austropuccinia psidii MF-1]